MSKLDQILGWSKLDQMAEELRNNSPATGLLLHDVHTLSAAGRPLRVAHSLRDIAQGMAHEQRKWAATAVGAATSTGVSMGVGAAAGVAGVGGAILVAGGITFGIAIAGILVGVAFSVAFKQRIKGKVADAVQRIKMNEEVARLHGTEYTEVNRLKDIRYSLTHGELEDLARFHEKAVETEKVLKEALRNTYFSNCDAACELASKAWTHKRRLEDRLSDAHQRDHVAMFVAAIDSQLNKNFALLEKVGWEYTDQLVRIYKEHGTLGQQNVDLDLQAFSLYSLVTTGKAANEPPRSEIRDYVELKFELWTNKALTERGYKIGYGDRDARKAIRILLHDGRTQSAGDHHDVAGQVSAGLYERAKKAQQAFEVTGGPSAKRGLDALKISGQMVLDAFRAGGTTFATSAAEVSRLGPMMASSNSALMTSGAAGFAAGFVVTMLLTELFDDINDKRNMERLHNEGDPVQRLWILRTMLQTKRLQTMYDSYKKSTESALALQPLVERIKATSKPAYTDLRSAAEHLFRIQKHDVRMLAFYGVLTAFMTELEDQLAAMLGNWDPATGKGLAEQTVDAIRRKVEDRNHEGCQNACYRMTARGPTEITVANRLSV